MSREYAELIEAGTNSLEPGERWCIIGPDDAPLLGTASSP